MKKILSSITILAAAGTLACAQEYIDATEKFDDAYNSTMIRTSTIYASVEGFYGIGSESDLPDLAGVWLTFGNKRKYQNDLIFDFGGILAAGTGEDGDITQTDVFVGGQLGVGYDFTTDFSAMVGVMAGVNYRKLDDDGIDNDDVGFFAGVYARADYEITDNWLLTLSAQYMITTAENTAEKEDYTYDSKYGYYRWNLYDKTYDSVSYAVITLGLKYTF